MNEEVRKNRYRRKKAMLKRVHKKIGVAFFVIVVALLVLVTRILIIHFSDGEEYSKIVLDHQTYTSTTVPYQRGQILDRNGTILAYSEKVYNLILDPKLVLSDPKYKEPTLAALVECFGLERASIEELLSTKPASQYEKLLKELSAEEIAKMKALQADTENHPYIKGVWFEESYVRKYPFSTLACDVIGFSSIANGGELGIENYYDDELSGTDGVTYSYVDDRFDVQSTQKAPVDGNHLIMTLDYNVQNIIEKHIRLYNEEKPSNATAVLVMDPKDAGVLGMASYPSFDLNNPRDLSGIYSAEELEAMSDTEITNALYSVWSNYCVSNIYEPGSTFKPFTVAAGLEEGVARDGDTFECTGFEEVGGWKIGCHTVGAGGHGILTLEQSLMESCNPAMMQIAAKLGGPKFAQYSGLFGFGSRTGIDLPGEEAGLTKDETMSAVDLACNAFGQNMNVNMVQMAAAFSSLINGGSYYQPHMIKRIEKPSGEVVKNVGSTLVKQTVTPSTSSLLRRYLKETVDSGLAKKAGVTGYSIAGKTGTAQKQPREDKKWIISFLGFAPADDPKFVIYVIIDEPDGTNGTSGSSADVLQLTHDIMTDLLPYMNVYKDVQAEPQDTSGSPVEGTVEIPVSG